MLEVLADYNGNTRRSSEWVNLLLLSAISFVIILGVTITDGYAFDAHSLPQVGYHPGGIAYWDTPYFSNALYYGRWIEYADGEWGSDVDLWQNPQFDENGFPQYLNPNRKLRAICYALHSNYGTSRPSTWPVRSGLAEGHVVLTWQGEADIRLHGGTFVAAESSGGSTGNLVSGRRVYLFSGGSYLEWLEVHAINQANPITDIKVWLADPSQSDTQSLEDQLFHPLFLERLQDADWGFIRFMNFLDTNANPQQDWSDRRPPAHCQMTGVLNPRSPATGSPGNRGSGMAFEYMAALCNAATKDLWVCVPHLATDDFVRKLAQLIRYGSDGTEPYASDVSSPLYPPLDPSLRVYIEYSNEIWSSGYSFPQGNWAQEQADALSISKPEFNARRFCEIWQIFQEVFDSTDRLVRVAAVFTAADWYTQPFLEEVARYGVTLSPSVEPDVIALTTYFGNGIQDWVYKQAQEAAGTSESWFLTTETFDAGGGTMRPVSLPPDDPYWTSDTFEQQIQQALHEWTRRLLAGDAREGAGPDAVGVGGGFDLWLKELAETTFPQPKPLIAYEGGPSLYTDNLDGGDSRDDGLTTFMEAMNRHSMMHDVYAIHLNMAKSKGLWTHVAFTDCSSWGKYGQWGHLEHLDQSPESSPKYSFMLDWTAEMNSLQHPDHPLGATPEFSTEHQLPVGLVGEPYLADISVSGGDGTPSIELIGKYLAPGLVFDPATVRLQGTPEAGGLSYLYLRVVDGDGDPAWRTFSLKTVGEPGTLVEVDFSGTDPALHLPWTGTFWLAEGVTYSGWDKGLGIVARDGDSAIVWSVNAPADETNSTLALAISDQEYLSMSVQAPEGEALNLRGAEVRFGIRRIDYHSPRRYAVMTSVEGFDESSTVFTSDYDNSTDDQQISFLFPDHESYENLTDPVEIRIYGFSGQYGGHRTSLFDFVLKGLVQSQQSGVGCSWFTY